jgi:hypothetical protein
MWSNRKFPFNDYVYESQNTLRFQVAHTIVTEFKNKKYKWTNEHIFFYDLEGNYLANWNDAVNFALKTASEYFLRLIFIGKMRLPSVQFCEVLVLLR